MEHLLNCLGAGFTEIVCVCDLTVRRTRIEALLRPKLMPAQQAFFHFRTARQLQTRLAEIGQASQKSEAADAGSKAPATGVTEEIRMKLTGHSSKAMNDRYTHLSVGPLKTAMDTFPLFTAKPPESEAVQPNLGKV